MFNSEIWAHILSFLDVSDMCNVRITSSLLYQISLWKSVRRKLRIPGPLPEHIVHPILYSCSKLIELDIYTIYPHMFTDTIGACHNFTRLRKLILHETCGYHLSVLLQKCPNLEYLDLGNLDLQHTYFCPHCAAGFFLVADFDNLQTIKCFGHDSDEERREKNNSNEEQRKYRMIRKFFIFLYTKFLFFYNKDITRLVYMCLYNYRIVQNKKKSRVRNIFYDTFHKIM